MSGDCSSGISFCGVGGEDRNGSPGTAAVVGADGCGESLRGGVVVVKGCTRGGRRCGKVAGEDQALGADDPSRAQLTHVYPCHAADNRGPRAEAALDSGEGRHGIGDLRQGDVAVGVEPQDDRADADMRVAVGSADKLMHRQTDKVVAVLETVVVRHDGTAQLAHGGLRRDDGRVAKSDTGAETAVGGLADLYQRQTAHRDQVGRDNTCPGTDHVGGEIDPRAVHIARDEHVEVGLPVALALEGILQGPARRRPEGHHVAPTETVSELGVGEVPALTAVNFLFRHRAAEAAVECPGSCRASQVCG